MLISITPISILVGSISNKDGTLPSGPVIFQTEEINYPGTIHPIPPYSTMFFMKIF
jgi:hypothetical protein